MEELVPLSRQRSCCNISPFVPCVNKAAAHLECLRAKLLDWQNSREAAAVRSQISETGRESSRQSRAVISSGGSIGGTSSTRDVRSEMKHSRLEIRGITTGTVVQLRLPVVVEGGIVSKPDLGQDEVLGEVEELVRRLEEDRRRTEEELEEEKERYEQLKEKVGELQEKRLHELPQAVQYEHEACAMDIAELQWHVAFQGRVQDRKQLAAKRAAKHNLKMKEEVDFLREQCPQLEKKLLEEEEQIGDVRRDLNETLDLLNQEQKNLLETEDKKAQAYGRSNQERTHIERNLDRVRDNLRDITDELQKMLGKRTANSQKIYDANRQLVDDKKTCQMLDQRHENCLKATVSAEERVNGLKTTLLQLADEQKQIEAKNDDLSSEMEAERRLLASEQGEHESRVKEVKSKLKKTQAKNEQLKDEIHIMKEDIVRCHESAARDSKTIKRSERDLVILDEQLQVSVDECLIVEREHKEKLADLHGTEDTIQNIKNSLQVTLDTLMVQLKEESHTKTLTQARIKAETTETAELKSIARKKLETSSGKARNFEQQNATITTEREQLEIKLTKRQQAINELTMSLEDILKKHGDEALRLGNRNNELIPKDEELKAEVDRLSRESKEVDWKIDMLGKKLEDLVASMKIVERLEVEVSSTLGDLKKELEDKNAVIQLAREEEVALREELREVKDYCHDVIEKHANYMTERQDLFLSLKERFRKAISENRQLASEYNRRQSYHMKTKANLMNVLDKKLKLESSLRDHKQLLSLQDRMKSTLEDYYRLRGFHTENCYTACSVQSGHNSKRLESVEMRFYRALEEIKRFLVEQKTSQSCVQEKTQSSRLEPLQDVGLLTTSRTPGSDGRKRPACSGTHTSARVAVSAVSNYA